MQSVGVNTRDIGAEINFISTSDIWKLPVGSTVASRWQRHRHRQQRRVVAQQFHHHNCATRAAGQQGGRGVAHMTRTLQRTSKKRAGEEVATVRADAFQIKMTLSGRLVEHLVRFRSPRHYLPPVGATQSGLPVKSLSSFLRCPPHEMAR